MNKCIAIIAGEPNSISSEIIFKSWKLKNQFIHKPLFVIGSIRLLNLQRKKLKYQIKIKKINDRFRINDLKGGELPVYDIEYNQKKPFEKISNKSNKYIFKCFDAATKFVKDKKILGFINCPISKEHLFKNKYQGITYFL
jgi:4-hydroxy-L-threonine phosphate dehydrogenase PdxA